MNLNETLEKVYNNASRLIGLPLRVLIEYATEIDYQKVTMSIKNGNTTYILEDEEDFDSVDESILDLPVNEFSVKLTGEKSDPVCCYTVRL